MSVLGAFIVPHPPLIVPQIGRGEEGKIQKTIAAYEKAAQEIAALKPDSIVLTTPHSVLYSDYLHISPGNGAKGDFSMFGAPGVIFTVSYDTALRETLIDLAQEQGIPAGTLGERSPALDHGTMVPLYFLNQHYRDYRLIRVSLSGLSRLHHYRLGKCIARAAEQTGRKVVIIASGDLSHKLTVDGPYGYVKEGPEFDKAVTEAMAEGDFLRFLTMDEEFCEKAAECGLRSFVIMAGALDGKAVKPRLLSYQGPFGVGYAVAAFEITGDDPARCFDVIYEKQAREKLGKLRTQEPEPVRIARESLEYYLRTKKYLPCPANVSPELAQKQAGVFVSLKLNGQLRGCIGTIAPTTPSIAEEIIRNAVSAGTQDPRFDLVEEDELPYLVYSVDVLGKPEPVSSKDELDPRKYGVIVESGWRRGLLLPNLEGINTAEEQVSIALQKAGIRKDEPYSLKRFEVVRYK